MTDTATPTYGDFARDLRVLADRFDALDGRLPLPHYPSQGLTIDIHTASHLDVDQAAGILDVPTRKHGGHTTAALGVGTVTLSFVHVDDATMAQHKARMDYARTMPASVPA
jgi:hypothetical protein